MIEISNGAGYSEAFSVTVAASKVLAAVPAMPERLMLA